MSISNVTNIKIFPGIGIGRVGNSSEYFIGPEAPGIIPDPGGGLYKDGNGNLKRQAARYRVYGYDDEGNVVMEITANDNVTIEWEVHMANKKAANYAFQGKFGFNPSQKRNPGVQSHLAPDDRSQLIIDPGPKTISGLNCTLGNGTDVPLDGGSIFEGVGEAYIPKSLLHPGESGHHKVTYGSAQVSLGRLETDGDGRLIIVPGEGKGESLTTPPLPIVKGAGMVGGKTNTNPTSNGNSYFNNPGWYDDTGGGSVNARVTINGGPTFDTNNDPDKRGWIAVAPPKYGPAMYNVVSLLDLQYNIFPEADPNAGNIFYAVTGINNSADYLAMSSNGSGFQFQNVTGSSTAGARPSIAGYKENLYYAVTGSDGQHNYIGVLSLDDFLVRFTQLPHSLPSEVGPSIAVYNGLLYYAINHNGNIYMASSSDGTTFTDFEQVGNVSALPNPIPIASNVSPSLAAYNGDLYLAVTDESNQLFLGTLANGFLLEQVGGSAASELAPSIANFDGQLYYAVTGTDQGTYLASWNNNGTDKDFNFSFQRVGGSSATALAPSIASFNGKIYYAVTGLDQGTYLASAGPDSFDFSFQRVGGNSLSNAGPSLASLETVSYYRDIYPTLKTVTDYAWVNQPAFNGHGPGSNGDFLREPYGSYLADPTVGDDNKSATSRVFVFRFIRPGETLTDAPPPPHALPTNTIYDGGVQRGSLMPHLFGDGGSPTENNFNHTNFPNQWLSLTRHQLAKFQKWVNGDFETGEKVTPVPLDQIALSDQPKSISIAALQPTVGGGFHPGIELTYNMKFPEYFADAFRFADAIVYEGQTLAQITPGSVAAYMSIPWHGDFWSCNISWWAAQRPDITVQTLPQSNPQPGDPPVLIPVDWFRSEALYIPPDASNVDAYLTLPNSFGPQGSNGTTGYDTMAKYWCKFGIIVPSGDTVIGEEGFTEVERDSSLDQPVGSTVPLCDTD